jgi:hypothetical protein
MRTLQCLLSKQTRLLVNTRSTGTGCVDMLAGGKRLVSSCQFGMPHFICRWPGGDVLLASVESRQELDTILQVKRGRLAESAVLLSGSATSA